MKGSTKHDVHDFQREVIERSYQIPVVVDFWAEWCGPCKILGPVLDRLAGQQSDWWALAKVDTEELTGEAVRYGIQNIPNVKMFSEGKVIGEFVGALPEYAVAEWLKKVLPGKNKKQIESVKALIVDGRDDEAKPILENVLRDEPDNTEATLLLAKVLLFTDPEYAAGLIKGVDEPKFNEQREMISTFLHLFEVVRNPDRLPDNPMKQHYLVAIDAVLRKDFSGALKSFIEIIRNDRYFDEDSSRKACIAIFKYLGEHHPVTLEYRRDFSNALY
jgi:putative thioredoxin